MECLHAIVKGRVQGVGYRQWAVRRASALGLAGWVRNTPEGAVETVAEGPSHALAEWESLLHQGPHYAEVASVEARRAPATGEFEGFVVR